MLQEIFTVNFLLVIALIFFRAYYNALYGTYRTWAFAATIILIDLLASLNNNALIRKYFLTSEPYQPLLFGLILALGAWLLYCLLLKPRTRGLFAAHPGFLHAVRYYATEIIIFTETIAILLAYSALSDLANLDASFLVEAQPATSQWSFYVLMVILGLRLVWNLLFGSYQTLLFWGMFIAAMITFPIFVTRDSFAIFGLGFGFGVRYIFRYWATEERFYWFYAACRMPEARFAFLLHLAAATAELIAAAIILDIFTSSYATAGASLAPALT